MKYEARRAGDGAFYLVEMDNQGVSKELYVDGQLLVFETSEDAKDYIEAHLGVKPAPKSANFKRR